MKKTIFGLVLLVILVALSLFVTTKISSAYKVARAAVVASPGVLGSTGRVDHIFLSNFSQKTGPAGKGCTTILLFVVGEISDQWMEVRLENASHKTEWRAVAIRPGTGNFIDENCSYG